MVQGLGQFRNKWGAIPARARVAAIDAMEEGAEEVVRFMKANAPRDQGALIASIGWTWGEAPEGSMAVASAGSGDLTITIYAGDETTMVTNSRGVKFQNAKLQEFGTVNMQANPYFFASWRQLKRRVKSRLTRRVNKALKAL